MNLGWRKWLSHFLGWGGGVTALLAGVMWAGAPYHWAWNIGLWLTISCLTIYTEIQEYRAKFQDQKKTRLDIESKLLSAALACLAMSWWWGT